MIIDVDAAHLHYCAKVEEISKSKFLELIGLSPQTANNYQNSLSRQKVLQAAYDIKELTGLPLDKIIKPSKS